jgi:hypothetical protein
MQLGGREVAINCFVLWQEQTQFADRGQPLPRQFQNRENVFTRFRNGSGDMPRGQTCTTHNCNPQPTTTTPTVMATIFNLSLGVCKKPVSTALHTSFSGGSGSSNVRDKAT